MVIIREEDELLSNSNIEESGRVVPTGSWNVCVLAPVSRCVLELATVRIVVPAAETVEVMLAK